MQMSKDIRLEQYRLKDIVHKEDNTLRFARASEGKMKLKGKVNGATVASDSDSDEVGAYGVGAAVGLGALKIRAEYTMYDVNNIDDLYLISAGVTYHF